MLVKKVLFTIAFIIPTILFAQNVNITGRILEQDSVSPAIGASVSLLSTVNNAYLRGQQTNSSGEFSIEGVDPGTYNLQVSYVGFETYNRSNFVVQSGEDVDLGTIMLTEQGELISEVVIQGQVPDLEIGIDKKTFDVSQSMVSVGGSAQDVLGNVPTLQVESDGNISLRGSSNVRILVDGKESAMAGSDINAFLQSLPADAISKVEIMTNPSAKHDAEGQSGIVNIVLKKNTRTGLNGSINASGGSYGNADVGVTLNYRPGKFNYFGSYNFSRRNRVGGGFNDNTELIDGMVQDTSARTYTNEESSRLGYNHTVRLGTDYYASEKTTISLGANVSIRDNERNNDINYQYWNIPSYGASAFRTTRQFEDDLGLDLQLDFKQEFNREGEELMANISYGRDTEDGTNNFHQTYASGINDLIRNNTTTEKGQNLNLQLDYTLPFEEDHKFEAGYRTMIRNSEDTQFSELLDSVTNVFEPDYRVSNNFDMTSAVHALYGNYQRKLTDRFGAQIGLRAEQATLNSTYYSVDPSVPENERATDGKLDYFRLYPSVFLSYDVGEGQSDKVQLSYTRRVQRPRGWQVNPFLNISDEQNYRQGNPNLLPEDIHSFELGYSKFYDNWNFVSSVYYRRVNDMFMPFLYPDSAIADIVGDRNNVTYSRWENVADDNSMGVELISKVNIFSWWDVTGNANLFHSSMTPKAGFDVRTTNSFNWNANLTANVRFTPTFSAQARGDYRSGRKTLQGEMKPMRGVDLALKKDLWSKRANVMLNVRDAFNSRRFEMENYLPNQRVHFAHRWMKRTFTLSFSYRFGIQDLGQRDRENGPGMEEMDGSQF